LLYSRGKKQVSKREKKQRRRMDVKLKLLY
jgi:hypothetical protein